MVVQYPILDKLPPPKPDHSFVRRPESKVRVFFWKRKIWIESTFALTFYEPWEKVVVLSIFALLCTAIFIVLVSYLPHQVIIMRRRAVYYLWGVDRDEIVLWQYLGLARANGS